MVQMLEAIATVFTVWYSAKLQTTVADEYYSKMQTLQCSPVLKMWIIF